MVHGKGLQQGLLFLRFRGFCGELRQGVTQNVGMVQKIVPQGCFGILQGEQVLQKIGFLRGSGRGELAAVGSAAAHGQGVGPLHIPLLAKLQKAQNGFVCILTGLQKGFIEGQVIGGAVGDHCPAVSVGDHTPGGGNRLHPGNGADGGGQIFFVVDDLHIIKNAHIEEHYGKDHGGQNIQAKMLGFFAVHGASLSINLVFFSRPGAFSGIPTGTAPSWEKPPEGSRGPPKRRCRFPAPRQSCRPATTKSSEKGQ